jgi:geranylgeranyl diphosphate synthase type II
MTDFKELISEFTLRFNTAHFPAQPATLYEPCNYFLSMGGKRIRPILTLMGNELFGDIHEDAYMVAGAIELFHNSTLIHDDVMDAAPLRRGEPTVHAKYGLNIALQTGDVMLIKAFEYLNKINVTYLKRIVERFTETAKEVCEGQQYDMDFETKDNISIEEYIRMIGLKTSVLLAASLEMGAIIGGASEGSCRHLYQFGLNLGIAFQIQDDYLDAFGNPEKFGKEVGGDIKQNKKTLLLLHTLQTADAQQKQALLSLMKNNADDTVEKVSAIFKACGADAKAEQLKNEYMQKAYEHLEAVAVTSVRKKPLLELADFLVKREY